jgi:hypothetical protein
LQPVVWDRIKRERLMTESGGVRPYQGGANPHGTAAPQQYAPTWRFTPDRNSSAPETGVFTTTTPSGAGVYIRRSKQGSASVSFHDLKGMGEPSTGRSLKRFSEVFTALKNFTTTHKPKQIDFVALSPSHQKLYDKVAPKIAEELGGTLETVYSGAYRIHLK